MPISRRISPCLWFDSEAEEAARFYTAIVPNSAVSQVTRYGDAGHEFHRRPPGSVMTVSFELDGQPFTALNGGPVFRFNEAISLQVLCETQDEIDHCWHRLAEGGDAAAQNCGWLKDRYGVSWQVVPALLTALLAGAAVAAGDVRLAADEEARHRRAAAGRCPMRGRGRRRGDDGPAVCEASVFRSLAHGVRSIRGVGRRMTGWEGRALWR